MKKLIGKFLSDYHDSRENIAFQMPIDTEKQREAAVRYINYGIPHQDRVKLETLAYDSARHLEDPDIWRFHVFSKFYISLIDFKIDHFIEKWVEWIFSYKL